MRSLESGNQILAVGLRMCAYECIVNTKTKQQNTNLVFYLKFLMKIDLIVSEQENAKELKYITVNGQHFDIFRLH